MFGWVRSGWIFGLGLIALVVFTTTPFVAMQVLAQVKGKVSYLILGGTVEPLMITKPDDPMAGGIITEIMQLIFENSDYQIVPKIMPWKRMVEELRTGNDWITYGFLVGNEPDIPLEFSQTPIMAFNHVAITLKTDHFKIDDVADIENRVAILVENFHYPGLDPHLANPLVGEGGGSIKAVRAFTPKGTLRMLRHKRGDVVFGFHARMLYSLIDSGLKLEDLRFQDASNIIPSQPLYLTLSPQQPTEVKRLINRSLERMASDGTLERILLKYSGPADLVE